MSAEYPVGTVAQVRVGEWEGRAVFDVVSLGGTRQPPITSWILVAHPSRRFAGAHEVTVLDVDLPAPVLGDSSRLGRSEAFPCGACGNPFVPWFAPDELWNRVAGGPDATDDPGGMLCANCFLWRADAVVFTSAWSITTAQEVKEMSGMGWWAISGEAFIDALRRAAAGEDPDLLYAEHYANSDIESPEADQ